MRRFNVLEFVKEVFCDFINIGSWFCLWFLWRRLGAQFAAAKATNPQSADLYWNRPWIERCSGISEKPPQCNVLLIIPQKFLTLWSLILLVEPATNHVSERSASALTSLKTDIFEQLCRINDWITVWFSTIMRKWLTNWTLGTLESVCFNIKSADEIALENSMSVKTFSNHVLNGS